MTSPIERVLALLQGAKRSGNGWSARCPCHGDRHASLSVSIGTDGRVLLHCHANCSYEAVVAAIGLNVSDLFPEGERQSCAGKAKPPPPRKPARAYDSIDDCARAIVSTLGTRWHHSAVYPYTDEFVVLRFDAAPGEKAVRPAHSHDTKWYIGDPPELLPLFGIERYPDEPLLHLHEGEKCAFLGRALGFPAITSAHGANSAGKSDWSRAAGKTLIAFPDNDVAGSKYVQDVADLVSKLNPPAIVKVVELPDRPEHGDIEQFLDARKARGDSDAAIQLEIVALVAAAKVVPPSVSFGGPPPGASTDSWPDPEPLPSELLPVALFEYDLLPASFELWARDIAERMQCPPDFVAITVMVELAALIGVRVGIRPKAFDSWLVIVNLWGGIVGRPGVLKSPAIMEALHPLLQLESDARKEFQAKVKDQKAKDLVEKVKRRDAEKVLRDAVREDKDPLDLAMGMVNAEIEGVTRSRFIVYDSTVEKLGELLNENPNGLLCFRDELIGLLISLDKEGQEGARSFYLEAWAGARAYTYDRIGRGTIDIPSATLSLLGSIQPGKLIGYLDGATRMGDQDDGLVQRLQLLVWPDISPVWHRVDRWPDTAARDIANKVIRIIVARAGPEFGGELDTGGGSPIPFLRFEAQAQTVFNEWIGTLERRVRSGTEHPAFESHLSKYRSLVPSIALILHVADMRGGPVCVDALQRAIRWSLYLESHARRVFSFVTRPELHAAKCLGARILKGDVSDGFDARSIYRRGWSGLTEAAHVESALSVLAGIHWVREVVNRSTGGAPGSTWWINPKLQVKPPRSDGPKNSAPPGEGTDKTDASDGEQSDERPEGTDTTDRSGPSGGNGSAPPGAGQDAAGAGGEATL